LILLTLLKPRACGFRNYSEKEFAVSPEEIILDKAQLFGLKSCRNDTS
jgi:catalase-peroxidase